MGKTPLHVIRKIADLTIAGLTNTAIAKEVSLDPNTVGRVKKRETFQVEIARREAKVETHTDKALRKIGEVLEEAVDKVVEKMRDGLEESIQLRAAEGLLDRGGIVKQQKMEHSGNIQLETKQLVLIAHVMREMDGDKDA